jgi:hypothetical protein
VTLARYAPSLLERFLRPGPAVASLARRELAELCEFDCTGGFLPVAAFTEVV